MTPRESQLLVEEVAAAFGRGEIVVVADDDDRENEGDLFVAASMCTAEKMAFVIRHTSGIVCAPLSVDEAKRLHLDPMVACVLADHYLRHRGQVGESPAWPFERF